MPEFGENAEAPVLALIGDVVGSRELSDREDVQRRLLAAVDGLNAALGSTDSLSAPAALTAGDEVQALLLRPSAVVDVVRTLSDATHPVRVVFGLGWGTLTTRAAEPRGAAPLVSLLDGPCFHSARTALERAGKAGSWLACLGFGSPTDEAVSALFHLLGAVRRGWTERQAGITMAARERLQKDVAAELGVSPSVVSEALKAASFEAVRDGEAAAAALLTAFDPASAPGLPTP